MGWNHGTRDEHYQQPQLPHRSGVRSLSLIHILSVSLSSATDVLLEAMIKTIVMSTLWLMLATLVAVYFITERLVSPIRAMSKASKEFAAGHVDARVEVSGNDEVAAVSYTHLDVYKRQR